MAYVLVMGSLALSVSFTLGWVMWRAGGWAWRGLIGGSGTRKPKPRARKAPARQASPRSRSTTARKATPRAKAKSVASPADPWRLTRGLAALSGTRPLAMLTLLLYGLSRLVEFGMTQRPLSPPTGYHSLVNVLGWSAAALLALTILNLMARWRCRRAA